MKIAFQQTALGDISLAKCFARAKRSRVDGLGLCYRTSAEASLLGDSKYIMRVQSYAERFGITVTGLNLGCLCGEPSLIGSLPVIRQAQNTIRKAIVTASRLDMPDVILPFFRHNRIEVPEEFDIAVSAVSELVDFAEEHDVVLAIETSLHLNQLQEFLLGCDSNYVKICVDTGDVTACRHDPTSIIQGLGPARIAQVHIKDVQLLNGLRPEFNVRLGRGSVLFGGIANTLQSGGYTGWLVLETPPGDDRGAITSSHVEFVRRLFRMDEPGSAKGRELPFEEGVA